MSTREFCISVKTDSRNYKKLVKEIEKINNRYSDEIGPVCGLFAALKAKNDLNFAPVLFGIQTESKYLRSGEEIVCVWGERGYVDPIYQKFKGFEVGSGLDELLNGIINEDNQFKGNSAQNKHFLYSEIRDNKIVVPFSVQSIQQNSSIEENQDEIVIDESKPFDKQVDDVLSGADTTSSHLEVLKKTPPLLRMVGVPNLPILITAYHVKTITQENGRGSANYHGLNVDVVKKLPELLSDPVMIMDSLTRDDSVVIVTQTIDRENRPVIGAIKLAGKGYINSIEINSNILTSAYGKDNFQSFIKRNIEQGSVLYVDKEKSQELSKIPGIQFPDNFATLDFNTIIRKTNAFVNREEEKKQETTEKNEGSMKADTNNATAQSTRERVQQIRDEMVKTLLEHIEKNPTDWQSGWNNIAAGAPYNGKTNTAYRGMNALYLAVIGMKRGYKDTRWVTFNQAKDLGASVKKGEKSSPVIFFEFYDRATKKAFDSRTVKDMTDEEKAEYLKENVYAVMKYSSVFNAEQCHNFPERKEVAMSEEERAKQNVKIETIIANSSAPVRYDGGSRAYYSPGTDSIHLPEIKAFDTMQDYYATALHEIAHSTGHEKRLNRDLSGGFGSESYAKEELRAELACVFMQMEQGIQLNGKHITNHAAYLNSWLEAAKNDTSVFFKAAADAQKIADYVADNYLQATDVAVTTAENVAQEQTEEQPERNPMADYLRAEQPNRSVGTGAGERTWEQENIRDWYTSAYPNDEAGLDIHPNATFKDLREEVNRPNPVSVYGMLGEDSVVRERAFTRLAELSGSSYASIYSAFLGETAQQKLDNARALAKRLATETGEPYVTIEWSEYQALNKYDVMSLSEADKKLAALDAQEDKNEGYYKTKLHIDYVFEGDHNAYECCRFDIGSEGGGLVHHIDEFLKYDTFLDAEERQEAENALKYFKAHMDLSAMVDTAIASGLSEQEQFDVQSYVLAARGAVNSAVPFSSYKLPEMSSPEREDVQNHGSFDYRKEVHDIVEAEFINSPYAQTNANSTFKGQGVEIIRDYFLRQKEQELEYLDERQYQALYKCHLDGHNILDSLWQEFDAYFDGDLSSDDKITDLIEQFNNTYYSDILIDRNEPNQDVNLDADIVNVQKTDSDNKPQTVEEARNAMLDAQEQRQNHYAVRIENVPYIDPEDGYESEEPAQVIYMISPNGRIEPLRTIAVDDDAFYYLPYTNYLNYEPVEYEELEEIAQKVREPIQTYKDALRAELEGDTERRRSDAYYEQRVDDVLNEHYQHGLFERNIENPKYLSGMLYFDETFRGEQVVSLTKDESGKNVAIIASVGGSFTVAEDYHTDDGRNWGKNHYFADRKSAEEFRAKNYPSADERSVNSQMERRISAYAESLKKIDVELGYAARSEEYYRDRALKEIAAYESSDEYKQAIREDFPKDFIEDSPQDMAEITQNKPVEAQERKREWLSIEMPNSAVGKEYGANTLIRMPEGEYSHYALFIPTKFLKETDGKTKLRVSSDFTYRITNDGRQVELTGKELKDSFEGKQIGKKFKRVAMSRQFAQVLSNIEKNVPEEMKSMPNWCVYRIWQKDEDKRGKVIKSAVTGEGISKNDAGAYNLSDFTDFNTAMKYAKENNFAGVSFLLQATNGIACIDLDKCVLNVETGEMKEHANKLVKELQGTYMERSTSGNGLHIFLKDDILRNGKYRDMVKDAVKGDLEVFDNNRIISITGNMFSKTNALTRAGSAATVYLRQELGERKPVNASSAPRQTSSLNLNDRDLVAWIQRSKKGGEFNDLYNGRGITGDKSVDDAKLAHLLLYFNNGDKEQAFRIMRESGANRPDKPDSYYRSTISKIDSQIQTYAKRPTFAAEGSGKPKGKTQGNSRR